MRFPILVSPIWKPFLLPFGVTEERSYVEIDDGELRVRFGWFGHTFALDQIESAGREDWPLWGGIGWRTNFVGTVGLIGTYVNVVKIDFKEGQRVRMVLPLSCARLYVSVGNPQTLVATLSEYGATTARPARRRRTASGVTGTRENEPEDAPADGSGALS